MIKPVRNKRWGWLDGLGLILLSCLFLASCGDETTPVAQNPVSVSSLPIPTFTPQPVTPTTPTPTPIIVPPTDTPVPTATPAPTPTPLPTPTFVVAPLPTPRLPTPAPGSGAFREITVEQARNLNGYRALLPAYLPTGFKLNRLSESETGQPRIITMIGEYGDSAGHLFYLNTQVLPGLSPSLAPNSPTISANLTPVPTLTPRPTAGSTFYQETVKVRGQSALLSSNNLESSLSWSENNTRYFVNGTLSREEILKVAESLK